MVDTWMIISPSPGVYQVRFGDYILPGQWRTEEKALLAGKSELVRRQAIGAYINSIRNPGKKLYARAWVQYCRGAYPKPTREEFQISTLAAQNVRIQLSALGLKER